MSLGPSPAILGTHAAGQLPQSDRAGIQRQSHDAASEHRPATRPPTASDLAGPLPPDSEEPHDGAEDAEDGPSRQFPSTPPDATASPPEGPTPTQPRDAAGIRGTELDVLG